MEFPKELANKLLTRIVEMEVSKDFEKKTAAVVITFMEFKVREAVQ